jgi:Fe-S cluster assembly iron-binding protein IscA
VTQITAAARAHLIRLRRDQGLDDRQAARFVGQEGRVRLTFASAGQPGDREVEGDGIRVLIASDVAPRLADVVVTAREEGEKTVLVIQSPARHPAS